MKITVNAEDGVGLVYFEGRRGNSWNRVSEHKVEQSQTFEIEADQRIVIEGRAGSTLVYDHEQKAVRRIETPSAPQSPPALSDEQGVLVFGDEEAIAEEEAAKRRQAAIEAVKPQLRALGKSSAFSGARSTKDL